jgi:integrase
LVQSGLSTPRDHALVALLALNGLRISEALNADVTDLGVDRGHRTLRIVRKGGKHVTIPLAPRTATALDLYIGARAGGPIFAGATGQRLTRHAADRTVKRLARRAGIAKRISPHSLRHSFITAALDAGVPLRNVQEAASHADLRTTMRYDRGRQSLDRHNTCVVAAFVRAPPATADQTGRAIRSAGIARPRRVWAARGYSEARDYRAGAIGLDSRHRGLCNR